MLFGRLLLGSVKEGWLEGKGGMYMWSKIESLFQISAKNKGEYLTRKEKSETQMPEYEQEHKALSKFLTRKRRDKDLEFEEIILTNYTSTLEVRDKGVEGGSSALLGGEAISGSGFEETLEELEHGERLLSTTFLEEEQEVYEEVASSELAKLSNEGNCEDSFNKKQCIVSVADWGLDAVQRDEAWFSIDEDEFIDVLWAEEDLLESENESEPYWSALDDEDVDQAEPSIVAVDRLEEERIDPDLRLEQIVVDFMARIECDPLYEPILLQIFLGVERRDTLGKKALVRKNPAREEAIRKLIVEYAVSVQQLELIYSIKEIWYANEYFWSSVSLKELKSRDSYFLRNYRHMSWEVAYQFTEAFPFLSDPYLIEEFLLTRYEQWISSPNLYRRRDLKAFVFYIRALMRIAERYGEQSYCALHNCDFWSEKEGRYQEDFYLDQCREWNIMLELDYA